MSATFRATALWPRSVGCAWAVAVLASTAALATLSSCTISVDAEDYLTACAPGFRRCGYDATVEQCRQSGKGFEVMQQCGEGMECRNASCVSVAPPIGIGDSSIGIEDGSAGSDASGLDDAEVLDAGTDSSSEPSPLAFRARLQVVESVPGGFVDLGLCADAVTVAAPLGDSIVVTCSDSLFWRIEATSDAVHATAYRHDPAAGIAQLAGPLILDAADVLELAFDAAVTDGSLPWFQVRASGLLSGEQATALAQVGTPTLRRFGLWNLQVSPGATEAIEGVATSVELHLASGEVLDTFAFSGLASTEGDFLQSPPASAFVSFFTSNAVASWLLLSLEE